MTNSAAERLLSGQAWEDFCRILSLVGKSVERFGDEATDLDKTEWYRFCSRVVRNGLERFVENCEPERPRLRDASWRSSINFQNPDQDHLLCEFDEAREFRITGTRGTVPYFVLAAWSAKQPADIGARDWAPKGFDGLKEFDPATLRTGGFLQSDHIHFDENGNFEVIVSQTKPERGDWLKLEPDSVGLLVRVVYHERSKETPPDMRIERLDGVKPAPITPELLAANLAKAGQEVLGYAELVRSWWQDNLSKRPNRLRFSMQTYLSNGGVPDRHFAFGTWKKPASDALVVRFKPPECEYWIFQLCNIWQENLDNYEEGQGYVTKFTARYEPDGTVQVIVAEEDPGIGGNWVDSFRHVQGGMGLRLIKTQTPPPVETHLVPLADLKNSGWAALNENTLLLSGEIVD